jgi:hypothetical protein
MLHGITYGHKSPAWVLQLANTSHAENTYRIDLVGNFYGSYSFNIRRSGANADVIINETSNTGLSSGVSGLANRVISELNRLRNASLVIGSTPSDRVAVWVDGLSMYVRSDGDISLSFDGSLIDQSRVTVTSIPNTVYLSSTGSYKDASIDDDLYSNNQIYPVISYLDFKGQSLDPSTFELSTEEFEIGLVDSAITRRILKNYSNFKGIHCRLHIVEMDRTHAVYSSGSVVLGTYYATLGPSYVGLDRVDGEPVRSWSTEYDYERSLTNVEPYAGSIRFTFSELMSSGLQYVKPNLDYINRVGLSYGTIQDVLNDLRSNIPTITFSDTINRGPIESAIFCRRWVSDPGQYQRFKVKPDRSRRYARPDWGNRDVQKVTDTGYDHQIMPLAVTPGGNKGLGAMRLSHPPLDEDETIMGLLEPIQAMSPCALVQGASGFGQFKYIDTDGAKAGTAALLDLGNDFVIAGSLSIEPSAPITKCTFVYGTYTKSLMSPPGSTEVPDHPMVSNSGMVYGDAFFKAEFDIVNANQSSGNSAFTQIDPVEEALVFESPYLDHATFWRGVGSGDWTWSRFDPNKGFIHAGSDTLWLMEPDLSGFRSNFLTVDDPEVFAISVFHRGFSDFLRGWPIEYRNNRRVKYEIVEAYQASVTQSAISAQTFVGENNRIFRYTQYYDVRRGRYGTVPQNWSPSEDGFVSSNAIPGETDNPCGVGIAWNLTTPLKIAKQVFQRQTEGRVEVSGHLPLKYVNVQNGDMVSFHHPSLDHAVRGTTPELFSSPMTWMVTKKTTALDRIEVTLVLISKGIYNRDIAVPYDSEPLIEIRGRGVLEDYNLSSGTSVLSEDEN